MIDDELLQEEPDEKEIWLITYADMVTLLLALFIIIASISEIDPVKLEMITDQLRKATGQTETRKRPLEEILKTLKQIAKDNNIESQLDISHDPRGIKLEFSSSIFFHSGDGDLQPGAKPILDKVAIALNAISHDGYRLYVEGHTDDTPIQGGRYPSNWELSTARSTNVLRYFISKGIDPKVLAASGFADTIPKAPNRDAHGQALPDNQAKNRRVVIKVYK
jgi:chemotaxis protein MotB